MKLYLTLHETSELQTTLTQEEAEARLLGVCGNQFTGGPEGDHFQIEHVDRNPFRPQITVRLQLNEDGTLAVAEMKLHRTLLIFLCIWMVFVVAMAAWRGWLLLVMVPVFWAAGIVAFSLGVKKSKESLIEVLDATEVIG